MSRVEEAYVDKLKNRIFGVLCEKEKQGDWKRFLDPILIELASEIERSPTINTLTVFYKLSMLEYLNYEYFRSTIFECMNLLSKKG